MGAASGFRRNVGTLTEPIRQSNAILVVVVVRQRAVPIRLGRGRASVPSADSRPARDSGCAGREAPYPRRVPELPEVEVLVRHLSPLLRGRVVREVVVLRTKPLRPTTARSLATRLTGARFLEVGRRAKFLVFELERDGGGRQRLLGHLGMTGRMYLQPTAAQLPKHAVVWMGLGGERLVYEDPRGFGRFTLSLDGLEGLGPEALGVEFTAEHLAEGLGRTAQAVKVKLLDQTLVAGLGNIYAAEALFRAGVPPRTAGRRLVRAQIGRLWQAIREVLTEAIGWGSTVRPDLPGSGRNDARFYYGGEGGEFRTQNLLVYDRAGEPCARCGTPIRRIVQAARSTFFCPGCQRARASGNGRPRRAGHP